MKLNQHSKQGGQTWEETVNEAEKEWQENRRRFTSPLNIGGYLKSAQKYNEKMRKATYEALTQAKDL